MIRIDDGKVNAFTEELLSSLSEALDFGSAHDRAVLILGNERRLSAGFELSAMRADAETRGRLVLQWVGTGPQALRVASTGRGRLYRPRHRRGHPPSLRGGLRRCRRRASEDRLERNDDWHLSFHRSSWNSPGTGSCLPPTTRYCADSSTVPEPHTWPAMSTRSSRRMTCYPARSKWRASWPNSNR